MNCKIQGTYIRTGLITQSSESSTQITLYEACTCSGTSNWSLALTFTVLAEKIIRKCKQEFKDTIKAISVMQSFKNQVCPARGSPGINIHSFVFKHF